MWAGSLHAIWPEALSSTIWKQLIEGSSPMLGGLTEKLLDQKVFPWCLEQAYMDGQKTQSPYKHFRQLKSRREATLIALIGGLVVVWAILLRGGAVGWNAYVLLAIFCVWPIWNVTVFLLESIGSTLHAFELYLSKVLTVLELAEPPRLIHLMTLAEVRAHARTVIIALAVAILQNEERYGRGSEKVETLRSQINDAFDLLRAFGGLIPEADYRVHFQEAQRLIRAGGPLPSLSAIPNNGTYPWTISAP